MQPKAPVTRKRSSVTLVLRRAVVEIEPVSARGLGELLGERPGLFAGELGGVEVEEDVCQLVGALVAVLVDRDDDLVVVGMLAEELDRRMRRLLQAPRVRRELRRSRRPRWR